MNHDEIISKSQEVVRVLQNNKNKMAKVVNYQIGDSLFVFDFTENNSELVKLDLKNNETFNDFVFSEMDKNNSTVGIGKYDEDRLIYRRSQLFAGAEEARSLHLGIDLWAVPGTKVFSPLAGRIHSFQDNNHFGDYGPTIILEHELDGCFFYTLYGHLSRESLVGKQVGKLVTAGQEIATIGDSQINGNWPPHVHFQIMVDMLGKEGDFFGVAKPSERDYYLALCPNPNLILNLKNLYD
ncbi:MAG: peptidoglycan DD-metalloendopeptidase family protein [bacterium]|nr:peptidoglycan DD-metalloendopeptidase family protein [bacterium]